MPWSIHAGDVLAGRYEVDDLLAESEVGRFWSARDLVLARQVAIHVIGGDDPRAPLLFEAARRSARTSDRRILRVLDADQHRDLAFVVNEWGQGISLDLLLADHGPLSPRQAAWLVDEVADVLVATHEVGVPHGRLVPENVLIDHNGHVRLIGFAVDAALHGVAAPSLGDDVTNLGALLYAALTGKWAGLGESELPPAPIEHGKVLRPRRVRAGIPRPLDELCDTLLNHPHHWAPAVRHRASYDTAAEVSAAVHDFVGDGARFRLVAGGSSAAPQLIALPPEPHQPVRAPGSATPSSLQSRCSLTRRRPRSPPRSQVRALRQPGSPSPTANSPTCRPRPASRCSKKAATSGGSRPAPRRRHRRQSTNRARSSRCSPPSRPREARLVGPAMSKAPVRPNTGRGVIRSGPLNPVRSTPRSRIRRPPGAAPWSRTPSTQASITPAICSPIRTSDAVPPVAPCCASP